MLATSTTAPSTDAPRRPNVLATLTSILAPLLSSTASDPVDHRLHGSLVFLCVGPRRQRRDEPSRARRRHGQPRPDDAAVETDPSTPALESTPLDRQGSRLGQ